MISITDIITKSWDFYRKNFKIILPIMGLFFLISMLDTIIRSFVYQPEGNVGIYVVGTLISIPFYLTMLYLTIATIEFLARALKNERPALAEIYKIALKKLPMALLVSLVVGAIIIGGTILLIIPGIIFAIWFNFAIYTYILEGRTKLEALKESKILVRGRWWPVSWRVLAINVFWGLLTSAIVFGGGAILRLPFGDLSKLSAGGSAGLGLLLSGLTNALFSLSTPLIILGTLLLFFNLRETRSLTITPTKE